jgi:SnoaL-like domain
MTDRGTSDLAHEVEQLAARVRYLEDCEEIRQLMYTYARGVDRIDQDLLEQVYHPDAYDNHGSWEGDARTAIDLLVTRGRAGTASASNHLLGNMLIDIKGDVAHAETYFIAYQRQHRDGKIYTRARAGRYLDQFERRDGRWRVLNRQVVDDWSRFDEVVATSPDADMNRVQGMRDETDPSYRLGGFRHAER